MTHEELLAKIDNRVINEDSDTANYLAVRAVVELHKPWEDIWPSTGEPMLRCGASDCTDGYTPWPCLTIQTIEKALGE